MKLSIIIVSWNVTKDLSNCLKSIGEYPPSDKFEIIVVDNASSDRTVEFVRNKFPDVELLLIGAGPVENNLKKEAKNMGLENNIRFLGWMSHEEVLLTVSKCGISVALFKPDPINRYADPIKIKEYLACGCPVILTNVPDIANEIYEEKAGIAIKYSKEEVVSAVEKLLGDDIFFKKCRENAIKLASKYDWCTIFKDALRRTL